MMIKRPKLFDVLILIASLVLVFILYGNIIVSPNSYMFNDSGDGIKNYYTYAHHIKNDSSYTQFEGMNYPYGEHYYYTDSHPIITVIVKLISKVFPNVVYSSIGIINFLMILSVFLTYIVSYILLRRFKISQVVSFVGAIAIGLLAPQIFRLEGHYALSHSVAIPLTWLLLLRYKTKSTRLNILLLSINNAFWLLIHAYLGIILIGFVFFYFLIDFLSNIKKNIRDLKQYYLFVFAVIMPILVFVLSLYFTDTHVDRTNNPTGFFLYNAELDDILLPHFGLINSFIESFVEIRQRWEGWAYIGILSSVFFVFLLFSFIYHIAAKKFNSFKQKYFDNRMLSLSFLSALVLLIFSFGIPFKQFPVLIDILPIFKQFRATGRFDWVFYFVFMTFTFYYIDKLYYMVLNKSKLLANIGIFIILIFFFYDGWVQQSRISKRINGHENHFLLSVKDNLIPPNYNIEFGKYQAIIPMPFYHFGSEVFSVAGKLNSERVSMLYSYHFNLPMMSAYLTRVSIPESKKIISVLSPTYYKKELEKDIISDDPFLIIETNEKKSYFENAIIKRSEFLFALNGLKFYKILPKDLFKYTGKEELAYFNKIKNTKRFYKNGFYLSDTTKYYYFNSFDYKKTEIKHTGQGSGKLRKNEENLIIEFAERTFKEDATYTLSFWVYNAEYNLNEHFRFGLVEYNNEDTVAERRFFPELSKIIYGDWTMVKIDFKMKDINNKVKLYSKGSVYSSGYIYYDDLLVFEHGIKIYKVLETDENGEVKSMLFNNHLIE